MKEMPVKKLERVVQKSLIEWLSPIGFTLEDNGGCGRRQGDMYTYIACIVTRIGGANRVMPFGQMGFLHRKRIYSAFMSDDPDESNKIAVDLQVKYAHFTRDWNADMRCQYEEELDDFLESLRAFIMDKLYPTLMAYVEPRKLLELYLKKDETDPKGFDLPNGFDYSSALTALILARLHGPEHYAELKQRYKPVFAELTQPQNIERVGKLIAYLDQPELTPIV